jgi:hypothetical protein
MKPRGALKLDGRSFRPADSRDNRFRSIFGRTDGTPDPTVPERFDSKSGTELATPS